MGSLSSSSASQTDLLLCNSIQTSYFYQEPASSLIYYGRKPSQSAEKWLKINPFHMVRPHLGVGLDSFVSCFWLSGTMFLGLDLVFWCWFFFFSHVGDGSQEHREDMCHYRVLWLGPSNFLHFLFPQLHRCLQDKSSLSWHCQFKILPFVQQGRRFNWSSGKLLLWLKFPVQFPVLHVAEWWLTFLSPSFCLM